MFYMQLSDVAPIITAIGVCLGALTLWNTRQHAVTTFEDSLANEYRQLIGDLPNAVLLGETATDEILRHHQRTFYRYFDLSNSQVFLRNKQSQRQDVALLVGRHPQQS
jgi:hypothetical protein